MTKHETLVQLRAYLEAVLARLAQSQFDALASIASEPLADIVGPMWDGSDCQYEAELLEHEQEGGAGVLRLAVTVIGCGESLGADLFAKETGERWTNSICRFEDGISVPLDS